MRTLQALRAAGLRRAYRVRSVSRPAAGGGQFALSYVRTGPFDGRPTIVVVPGGPGLGSVVPYAGLRRWARRARVDLLMIEHRGVGLSRRTDSGADLSTDDMWLHAVVDDIRAVLDAEGITRAVLYGSSYGTYVVQAFTSAHADRVDGVVLDSPILGTEDHHAVRAAQRAALWDVGSDTATEPARSLHALVADGIAPMDEVESVARVVYEFCGPETLSGLVTMLRDGRGRPAWRLVSALANMDTDRTHPYVMEFDLVGTIAFRELNYAPTPDGLPFDPGAEFAETATGFPAFAGEPYDLPATLRALQAPVVVLSGARDLRTPRSVAERIVDLCPNGNLVPLDDIGHSILDTAPKAARIVLETVSAAGVEAICGALPAIQKAVGAPSPTSAGTYLEALLRVLGSVPWPGAAGHR